MSDSVLAQLAALKTAPVADLKQKWRDLFDREPPPYNRRFLESRLAYRIQELAYGGLSEETIERLEAIADELEGKRGRQRSGLANTPIAGTRLIREWKGVEHSVTVPQFGFRIPRPSLQIAIGSREAHHGNAVERARFLRAEEHEGAPMKEPRPVIRKLRCAVYTRKSTEEGLEQEFNSLDAQREACEAYVASQKAEGWLLLG